MPKCPSLSQYWDVNKNYTKMKHELDRIDQFIREAGGDEEKLKQKLLVRAGRCSQEKLQLFVRALDNRGLNNIANYIRALMIRS